jgi:hypothetical protein
MVSLLLGELVPITKGCLETHGTELESVFKEPSVLGFSIFNYAGS